MRTIDESGSWSSAHFALLEGALWQDADGAPPATEWLDSSWKQPMAFFKALHAYWERRQASQSQSIPGLRYDFYYDVLERQKNRTLPALIWFEKDVWHTWSYARLELAVNGLAAAWEAKDVQPGETLTIVLPQGPYWLMALLAGLRLGLVVSLAPPQGNAFVARRLANLAPQWLAIDALYRHQLGPEWQDKILPSSPSASAPVRRPYAYPSRTIAVQGFDVTSPSPDAVCEVDADTLYLGAMRDGVLALGIKPGQACAAPGWHSLESQPALILAVLLSGGAWVHIELADIAENPQRLLEPPIDILGVSRPLRDILLRNPPRGEKSWRYWFRHPAEAIDFSDWQDFIRQLQLEKVYAGNLLCSTVRGGAILFSPRVLGKSHFWCMPAAGMLWQLGIVNAPELPCLGGWGRVALGKETAGKITWTALPYLLTPFLTAWNYLGHFPRGRAGRTYPSQEVLDLLADKLVYRAMVDAAVDRGGADPRQVLLVFGVDIDTAVLQAYIETELGAEFLPDRIECLPFLPKRNAEGGADQAWCQFHYVSGELYRRQRSPIHACLSELKRQILGEIN
jgi:hypothetical protein